jgi:hypothetical protein
VGHGLRGGRHDQRQHAERPVALELEARIHEEAQLSAGDPSLDLRELVRGEAVAGDEQRATSGERNAIVEAAVVTNRDRQANGFRTQRLGGKTLGAHRVDSRWIQRADGASAAPCHFDTAPSIP